MADYGPLSACGAKVMATYDHGGGCDCGLYAKCLPTCEHNKANQLSCYNATHTLRNMMRLTTTERHEVMMRLHVLLHKGAS
jgi:hypothetical protein